LTLNQYDLKNVVATLGTALTSNHVKILKRYTNKIYVVYDGDESGINAATRGLGLFLEHRIYPYIIILPFNSDPDKFLRDNGKDSFMNLIEKAPLMIDYFIDSQFRSFDPYDVVRKNKIVEDLAPLFSSIKDDIYLSHYVDKISNRLEVDKRVLLKKMRSDKTKGEDWIDDMVSYRTSSDLTPEELIIKSFLVEPYLIIHYQDAIAKFQSIEMKRIGEVIMTSFQQYGEVDPSKVLSCLFEVKERDIFIKLYSTIESIIDPERTVKDCVKNLSLKEVEGKIKHIQCEIQEFQQTGESDYVQKLLFDMRQLVENKRLLVREAQD
ncbi:MAG: toprim domain-containing protein, partial [Thermodesulfobacteriota bacterium]|nr:toprim domain-containing protein [Thermodesulfobacteriota bacterium]